MFKQLKELNSSFNKGILPNSLNFSIVNTDEINLNMLKYNAFYKSFEYTESKFPAGYESIPGMDKVIESCIPKLSPLEEMNLRHEEKEKQE
jgi:hypothetical protein